MENNLPHNNKLNLLLETLANSVSDDKVIAKEYLEEEGIDVDTVISKGLNHVKKLQAQMRLELGKQRKNWFELQKEKFKELQKKGGAEFEKLKLAMKKKDLQLNFRNLEEISDEELGMLFKDAQFLDFLHESFPNEEPPE